MDTSLSRASPRAVPVLGGRYELLFARASGGMGTVYVGRRIGPSGFMRLVAIKRMHPSIAADPDAVAAFHDEARIASLVEHANVVAIHDVGELEGEHVLVMDYIDGASLADLLSALRILGKRLSTRIALRIVTEALRGLHAAHELSGLDGRRLELVHRDATPHNILIGVDGSVRLTDFGIARAITRTVHTDPGFAKGKYAYMAPEQAFAEPVDCRADVFSMGVVAWEALTGRRLFDQRTMQEVARGVALGLIAAPSEKGAGAGPAIDRVVMRALAPWRDDRYPTAGAFANAIEEAMSADGGLSPTSSVAEVLDLACGAAIRARRQKVRDAIAAADAQRPTSQQELGSAESGVRSKADLTEERDASLVGAMPPPVPGTVAVTRIATPSATRRDVAAFASTARGRARWAAVVAAVCAALGLGVALGAYGRAPAVPRAAKIGPHALRVAAETRADVALAKVVEPPSATAAAPAPKARPLPPRRPPGVAPRRLPFRRP